MRLWARLGPGADTASCSADDVQWRLPGLVLSMSGLEQGLHDQASVRVAVLGRLDELAGEPVPAGTAGTCLARHWARRGPRALRGSVGDFVAVVHEPGCGRTWFFRDLVGTVPLYVAPVHHGLIVTTSLPDLVDELGAPRVDERWMRSYLDGMWPRRGSSPYADIQLLPPGSVIVADAQGATSCRALDDWRWSNLASVEDPDLAAAEFRRSSTAP